MNKMLTIDMHTALTDLAASINRLRPDWRNADEFYTLRSEISARLRSLADSPLAVKKIIQPVRIEVPAPAPAPWVDGLPVTLNADELARLLATTYARSGGWQSRYCRWQRTIDRNSGLLVLTSNDIAWIWRHASRPWKGGFQSRTRKIFWRALQELFASLGLKPSVEPILPTSRGRRAGKTREAPRHLVTKGEGPT